MKIKECMNTLFHKFRYFGDMFYRLNLKYSQQAYVFEYVVPSQ